MASHQVKAAEMLSKDAESYNGWSVYFPESEAAVEKGGVEPSSEPPQSTTVPRALVRHSRVILHQTRRSSRLANADPRLRYVGENTGAVLSIEMEKRG